MHDTLREAAAAVTIADFFKTGSGARVVHPDLARTLLGSCQFVGQRAVNPAHVETLALLMLEGQWFPGDQLTFCAVPGAGHFLVNGYHRLHAVIEAQTAVEFNIRVLQAHDMEGVRRAYASFDTVDRKRGPGDILQGLNVPEEYGIIKQVGVAVLRAIPYLTTRLKRPPSLTSGTILRRADLAEAWWPVAKTFQDHTSGCGYSARANMLHASILAPALATVRHHPEKAAEFWPRVATKDMLEVGDPRLTLANRLSQKNHRPFMAPMGEYLLGTVECALAWNAFCAGRKITQLRAGGVQKFSLTGTPF